jgi:hypothetical protein
MPERYLHIEDGYWRIRELNRKLSATERTKLKEYFGEIRYPYRHIGGELCVPAQIRWGDIYEVVSNFYDGTAQVSERTATWRADLLLRMIARSVASILCLGAIFFLALPVLATDDYLVHAGKIRRTFRCAPEVEAGAVEDGVLHADLRRGGDRYLLIAYSEPSRQGNPNAMCGGGVESYIVWLHLRAETVVAAQSIRYASCWKSISAGRFGWSGPVCSVSSETLVNSDDSQEIFAERSKVSFDSRAPEKGLVQTTLGRTRAR